MSNAQELIQGRRFWTACSDGDVEQATAILNTNPGDSVINFKMQKKISGTPLDAAIYFKKDKLLFTLKAWNRYSELKLDYYKKTHNFRVQKNQQTPEFVLYSEVLTRTEVPQNFIQEKKFQTKDDQIEEMKRTIVEKDQIIFNQSLKIEELQKELESWKASGNAPKKTVGGGNNTTNNNTTTNNNNNVKPNFRSGGSNSNNNNVNKSNNNNDSSNNPTPLFALRKTSVNTTKSESTNPQNNSDVDDSKPQVLFQLRKTNVPIKENVPTTTQPLEGLSVQLRKTPNSPRSENNNTEEATTSQPPLEGLSVKLRKTSNPSPRTENNNAEEAI